MLPKLASIICLAYKISILDTPVINVNVIRCNSSKISIHYILNTVKIGPGQYKKWKALECNKITRLTSAILYFEHLGYFKIYAS